MTSGGSCTKAPYSTSCRIQSLDRIEAEWMEADCPSEGSTKACSEQCGPQWGGGGGVRPCPNVIPPTQTIRLQAGGAGEGHHIQHSPNTPTTALRERGNDTSKSTGRSGRQKAATRRNMRREERVTVQGPVKEQQPHGMSHRGGHQGLRREARGTRRSPAYVVHPLSQPVERMQEAPP